MNNLLNLEVYFYGFRTFDNDNYKYNKLINFIAKRRIKCLLYKL